MALVVLGLVFVAELLAAAAVGIWGGHAAGALGAVAAVVVFVVAWGLLASPRARYGGPAVRPAAKVVLYAWAVVGLWYADRQGWAIALLVLVVLVHAAAALPAVRRREAELGSVGDTP